MLSVIASCYIYIFIYLVYTNRTGSYILTKLLHLSLHCLAAYPGEHGVHIIVTTRTLHVVAKHGLVGGLQQGWKKLTTAFGNRAPEVAALRPDILMVMSKTMAGMSLAASG